MILASKVAKSYQVVRAAMNSTFVERTARADPKK